MSGAAVLASYKQLCLFLEALTRSSNSIQRPLIILFQVCIAVTMTGICLQISVSSSCVTEGPPSEKCNNMLRTSTSTQPRENSVKRCQRPSNALHV